MMGYGGWEAENILYENTDSGPHQTAMMPQRKGFKELMSKSLTLYYLLAHHLVR
jgi:hypothetical protein